ncbi:MAG TPA: hypothetical protein VGE52_06790 [Pirellulales bacterium]
MLTISRLLLKRFRTLCRKARLSRSPPPLAIESDGSFLALRLITSEFGLTFRQASSQPVLRTTLPFETLVAAESSKDAPLNLEIDRGKCVASWMDRGVPQKRSFDYREPSEPLPLPTTTAANGPELLAAITEASATTDDSSHRFALSRIQLQALGRVVGTDGRQLYAHDGFAFPWQDDLLVQRTSVFGAAEFAEAPGATIGSTATHVVVSCGDWTVHLPIDASSKFPRVNDVLPKRDRADGVVVFDRADAAYLLDVLPRLPAGPDDDRTGVALNANGRVVVEAVGGDAGRTDVVLPRSHREGAEVRLNVDRTYLARTLRLGFERILHYGPKSAVLCDDGRRQLVWAVMEPSPPSEIAPDRIVRLEPPEATSASSAAASSAEAVAARSEPCRSDAVVSGAGSSRAFRQREPSSRNSTTPSPSPSPSLAPTVASVRAPSTMSESSASTGEEPNIVERATRLQSSLREALVRTSALLAALKQQRRRERTVRATLASLRLLQTIEG